MKKLPLIQYVFKNKEFNSQKRADQKKEKLLADGYKIISENNLKITFKKI